MLGRGGRPRAQSPVLVMCQCAMPGTEVSVKAKGPRVGELDARSCTWGGNGSHAHFLALCVWPFIGIFCSNWVT